MAGPGPTTPERWRYCPVCGSDWHSAADGEPRVAGISSTTFDAVVATMCLGCRTWWRRQAPWLDHLDDDALARQENLPLG